MIRWMPFLLISVLLAQAVSGQTNPTTDLTKVQISSVSFAEAGLGEVLEYLSSKAEEQRKHPVNFILVGKNTRNKTLTLKLKEVSMGTVLKYACELTGNVAKVVPDGILVGTKTDVMRAQSDWNEAKVVTGRGSAATRLTSIKIPSLELEDTPISAVIQFLQSRMEEIKPVKGQAPTPNFLLIDNADGSVANMTVSLKLKNAPLSSLIRFVSATAGHEVGYRIDRRAVVFGQTTDLKSPPQPKISANPATYSWLKNKLIPKVNVSDASLAESLQLIRHYAGSNLNVINNTTKTSGTVSLKLENVSFATLLAYICEQTNTNFKLEKRAIILINGKKRTERKSTSPPEPNGTLKPGSKDKPVFDK